MDRRRSTPVGTEIGGAGGGSSSSTLEVGAPVGWPGLDPVFHERAIDLATSPDGAGLEGELADDLNRFRGKAFSSGTGFPLLVREGHASMLQRFAGAYHRCIEAIVRAWTGNESLRSVVRIPTELAGVLGDPPGPADRIHLCRLDLVPEASGSFQVAETNANCPGGLMLAGRASRIWRGRLSMVGLELPPPLEHETPGWFAAWFLQTAAAVTGDRPELVALLRWRGGNRLSLPGFARELRGLGVEVMEADPRELDRASDGALLLRGRRVRHAYWKLGIHDLRRARPEVDHVIEAMRRGDLFVQNGIAGRLVGDNKLCLAVLSDPAFEALFDPADIALVRENIPWSRNLALCSRTELAAVRSSPASFVLKRPLDTRGNGVAIGRDALSPAEWKRTVDHGVRGGWLVQEFCQADQLETCAAGRRVTRYHDLCLGLIEGRLTAAMSRSSPALRTNVAVAGCLHPVFMRG